jgi:hypothetical protein
VRLTQNLLDKNRIFIFVTETNVCHAQFASC